MGSAWHTYEDAQQNEICGGFSSHIFTASQDNENHNSENPVLRHEEIAKQIRIANLDWHELQKADSQCHNVEPLISPGVKTQVFPKMKVILLIL